MKDKKQITELAFRLQQVFDMALKEESLDADTLEALTQRMRQIRAGLAPEMEFVSAVNWLSKVVAIHRLDQTPQPKYIESDGFRIPDILALVEYSGHLLPILIEVKTSEENTLVWREDYLHSLQRYADAIHMPLLVAWKYHHIWALTDVRHFEKKVSSYHLDFNKAVKETLMSELFGDVLIEIDQRVKFFIDAEVAQELPPDPNIIIPEGGYTLTIKAAGFMVDDKIVKLEKELFWAFQCAPARNEVIRIAEQHVRIQYIPEQESLFSLTHLWQTLALLGNQDHEPDWETIMRRPMTIRANEVRQELKEGIQKGVVKYIFEISPQTVPDFLDSLKSSVAEANES